MRRLDRRAAITYVDLAGPAVECPVERGDLLARLHAQEDGRLVAGAEAFAAMWRAIPVLRALGLLARNPTVLDLLERGYLRFLKVRPKLQSWLLRRQTTRAPAA